MERVKKTENMTEYMKLYMREYTKNRDPQSKQLYNEKAYEYIVCQGCGNKFMRNRKTNHLKTKKHEIGVLRKKIEQLEMITIM